MSYWSVLATSVRDDTAVLTGSGVALRPWMTDAGTFDGASTVSFLSQADLAVGNHFTVAFWFRTPSFTGQQVLIESGGYVYGWAVLLSGSMLYFVWSNSYSGHVVSHDLVGRENDTIHVAFRVDGQQMTLLVDGQSVGSATHPTAYTNPGSNAGSIGGTESDYRDHLGIEHSDGPDHYFTGQIDQLLTFDSAIGQADLAELFAGPEPTNTTSPEATFNSRTVAWTPGVWDGHGNGALSLLADVYKDSVLLAADQTTHATTGGGIDASTFGQGHYEVAVKAINDGGESVPLYANAVDITPDPVSANAVASLVRTHTILTETKPPLPSDSCVCRGRVIQEAQNGQRCLRRCLSGRELGDDGKDRIRRWGHHHDRGDPRRELLD